ncbi:MAG: thioredoxin family protein [Bacteroidetes bacterium]|nr:thioredoxin family protein [Bacteroidota bacterium]
MKSETIIINSITSFSYSAYKDLVIRLSETESTTGIEQTIERIEATKLNAFRMKRIDKQIQISESLAKLIKSVNRKWRWTVLVEAWCGDGAQNIPIIEKMASINPNIDLKIILRDENTDIMDKHLTNGSRSIPILICVDEMTNKEIGIWGSRPQKIMEMAKNFKSENPNSTHDEFVKYLHLCYAKDKGKSIQNDFLLLILSWKNNSI